jgi:hypothetical protein
VSSAAAVETQRVNTELQQLRDQLAVATDNDARRAEVLWVGGLLKFRFT